MFVKFLKPKSLVLWLFSAGLFVLPLVFWPKAAISYEIPKVWFFQRWVEFLGILGVLEIWAGVKKIGQGKSFLIFLVALFILVISLSSLLGIDFGKSLLGNYYRQDGLLTLFHFAIFFYFLILFWEDDWQLPAVKSLVLGNFFASLWVIISGIRFHLFKDLTVYHFGGALGGTFGQPNFLAGYLLVSLPFTSFLIEESKLLMKKFWWLVLSSEIMAIFLTLSRAGAVGIVIFAAGWILLKSRKGRKLGWLGLLGILVVLLSGTFWVLVSSGGEWAPESRTRIFNRAVFAWSRKPILGWGWANFDYAYESVKWPSNLVNDVYVDKAHSLLLEFLVTTGLVGLAIYLSIMILVFKQLAAIEDDLWRRTLIVAFSLLIWHSQTNVISINEEMLFWLILGIVAAG